MRNAKEYEQQNKIKENFTERNMMRRVYHAWCNNKTELIHGIVVNVFLPNCSYFCCTICGKTRTIIAVSIKSLRYYEYYRRLYLTLVSV
jgi:hypothetical protein